MTITCLGKLGVQKNSRIARRYATPATNSGMTGNASPSPPKLREQMISETSRIAPSPYTL